MRAYFIFYVYLYGWILIYICECVCMYVDYYTNTRVGKGEKED